MTTENNNTDQYRHEPETDDIHGADEHNYDGIQELDNPPPGWIMFIFYITIGFAIVYGSYYFWLGSGPDQHEEYKLSVLKAQMKYESDLPAAELVLLTDEISLVQGRAIYEEMNCAVCHGSKGEGNQIGPNLTDDYWIHGCSFEDVFNMIKNGEPLKGMTPFKGQLSDERIQKVASYVLVLMSQYTPDDPKEPQGELCEQ